MIKGRFHGMLISFLIVFLIVFTSCSSAKKHQRAVTKKFKYERRIKNKGNARQMITFDISVIPCQAFR
jgi:hypothetical protein